MSNRSTSALQALIEAYARAKGVPPPAGDLITNADVFITIFNASMIETAVKTKLPQDGGALPVTYTILGKTFNFNSTQQAVEVLNAAANPRVVGSIRMQMDGNIVRFFDATNTQVDTIYTAKSANEFKKICDAFGKTEECSMVMAQCALQSFDTCTDNIVSGKGNLTFDPKEANINKLIQAYAFLKKLGWKYYTNSGKAEEVDAWQKRQSNTVFKSASGDIITFLKNIVVALNASDIPKKLNTKAGQVSSSPSLEEIQKALAEGNHSINNYSFWSPFGVMGMALPGQMNSVVLSGKMNGGGLDTKASEKLQAQFTKLNEILAASGKALASKTLTDIQAEIKTIIDAENAITAVIDSLSKSKNMDILAKQVVALRDNLKDANGTPLNVNGPDFIDEFTKAYEKMHVSIGKVAGALGNAYIIFGKYIPKASDVTADSLQRQGNNAPRDRLVSF
jgi:hypothetical protein|uniref:Uncharacterized protein n=1 Tax=viral metagenome TaxID=1070528 RepID=A0A6C0M0F5_9ZZZZ